MAMSLECVTSSVFYPLKILFMRIPYRSSSNSFLVFLLAVAIKLDLFGRGLFLSRRKKTLLLARCMSQQTRFRNW